MPTEINTETSGKRGATWTRIQCFGPTTYSTDTTPIQRVDYSERQYLTRHKPAGWLFPTSYRRRVSNQDFGNGVWQIKRKTPAAGFYCTITRIGCLTEYSAHLNSDTALPTFPSSIVSRAEIEALLSLKDQKVNFAQAFAERQMTADLLGSTLSRIARSVMLLRRRKVKEAWREIGGNPRTIPKTWLEYQYGWKPLLSDIWGSTLLLAGRKDVSDWVVTVKGNRTVKSSSEDVVGSSHRMRRKIKTRQGCYVRLDYQPGEALFHTLSSLGLTNPALLAWELLPYSFVIDWAVPIGDWLSSLDAANGMNFYSGSKTTLSERITRGSAIQGTPNEGPNYVNTVFDYSVYRREFDLNRVPYASSPLPGFPGFKDPFSLTHMANGFSLLSQALAGGRPSVR